MVCDVRNFFQTGAVHALMSRLKKSVRGPEAPKVRLVLRSLSGSGGLAEIPRRFSSSSLPPPFASGRFAGLFYATGRSMRPVFSPICHATAPTGPVVLEVAGFHSRVGA